MSELNRHLEKQNCCGGGGKKEHLPVSGVNIRLVYYLCLTGLVNQRNSSITSPNQEKGSPVNRQAAIQYH